MKEIENLKEAKEKLQVLQNKIDKIKELKLSAIKEQQFDLAATFRDNEKKLQDEIELLAEMLIVH
ncbi:MAG: UvrB/UvrC motif-containing protein [Ferruginibacter sp.]|nr:hypothetical protein [Ferruginibacter sp.]